MLQQDIRRAVRAALLEDLGDALTALDRPDASADITAQLIPADRISTAPGHHPRGRRLLRSTLGR